MSDLVFQSREPAKTYKFTLDPFQSRSVLCLENDQSVLVSAHTSAGKTVVAEVGGFASRKYLDLNCYSSTPSLSP